jgi:hypothetical protein
MFGIAEFGEVGFESLDHRSANEACGIEGFVYDVQQLCPQFVVRSN